MEIRVEHGDITKIEAPCVVVNLFEGVTAPGGATGAMDRALEGQISELIASGDIRGKSGEIVLLHTFGKTPAPRVVIAGLGKASEFNVDKVRDLGAALGRFMRSKRVPRFSTIAHGAGIGGLDPAACAQALTEGAILGLYRFDRHKKTDDDAFTVEAMTIVESDAARLNAGIAAASSE